MVVLSIFGLWTVIGTASGIYWWTKDHDLTTEQLFLLLLWALLGPIAFYAGWSIHGAHESKESKPPLVIFKRQRGFTIVELMIGLAILGIVLALLWGGGFEATSTSCKHGYVFVHDNINGGMMQLMDEVGKGVRC